MGLAVRSGQPGAPEHQASPWGQVEAGTGHGPCGQVGVRIRHSLVIAGHGHGDVHCYKQLLESRMGQARCDICGYV